MAYSRASLASVRHCSWSYRPLRARPPLIGHQFRPHPVIERLGWLVPVEHRPFEAAAAAIERDAGEMAQQRGADPASSRFGRDVQIFKIEPAPPRPGRELVEEQREAQTRTRQDERRGGTELVDSRDTSGVGEQEKERMKST